MHNFPGLRSFAISVNTGVGAPRSQPVSLSAYNFSHPWGLFTSNSLSTNVKLKLYTKSYNWDSTEVNNFSDVFIYTAIEIVLDVFPVVCIPHLKK